MIKVILMLLLAVVSNSAMAEWSAVIRTTDNGYIIYANYGTIHKADNRATMWFMDDFKTAKKDAGETLYMSSKEQFRFDCKNEQWQTLAYSLHSEKLAEGALIYSDSNRSKWEPIRPGSQIEVFWKFACGRK
jgi:hypothetical protein